MELHGSKREMLTIATRTTAMQRVAMRGANRQNEYSRCRMLRRYGVT
jgi:hypothetical protein